MTTKHTPGRTDIHRPSVINPQDYEFLFFVYYGSSDEGLQATYEERRELSRMIGRGETYVREFADRCQCCGASALWYGIYRHTPSRQLFAVGHQCSIKLSLQNKDSFKHWKKDAIRRNQRIQQEEKAKVFCDEKEIALYDEAVRGKHYILADLYNKVVAYGTLSDKQIQLAKKLLVQADAEAAKIRKPAPEGKLIVTGIILGFKEVEDNFSPRSRWSGPQMIRKAIIETAEGWKLYVTVPKSGFDHYEGDSFVAGWEKGQEVRIRVTVQPSMNDPYFAVGKRPQAISKAEGRQ